MNNSDQDIDGSNSFYDRYSSFSDSQIKEILRNHKNYQDPAVTTAVKVAIERELIHSEQDLLAPEYQSKPLIGFSLFPEITNDFQYKKIVASIFRMLFFLSILPIIFGVLKYAEGQINMTFIGVGLGAIWLIINYLFFKTEKMIVVNIQIVLLILVFFGIGYRLLFKTNFQVTDLVILVFGTLLFLYLLLYLKKLIQTKTDKF
jgi:hypothetical protein